jgi:hypothetical protein
MGGGRGQQHRLNNDLMIRLGLEPPDTAFNRRAAEYSRHACKLEAVAANMARQKARKISSTIKRGKV